MDINKTVNWVFTHKQTKHNTKLWDILYINIIKSTYLFWYVAIKDVAHGNAKMIDIEC